jgi:hypothetical protein
MRGEDFKRDLQGGRRKVRTVAVERDDVLPSGGNKVSKDGG